MKLIAVAGEAELPSEFDFEQATRAIMFEEAHGYQFKSCTIKKRGGTEYNSVVFTEYFAGPYPSSCLVHPKDAEAPKGYVLEASTKMVLKNKKGDVCIYRKTN